MDKFIKEKVAGDAPEGDVFDDSASRFNSRNPLISAGVVDLLSDLPPEENQ